MSSDRAAEGKKPAASDATNPHREDPPVEGAGAEPTLPVAAVARRLGVAPATLRTWDRRYGVGPSGHTNGKHRRYAPVDIGRLEVMQRALLSGASTAEAAQFALDSVHAAESRAADVSGAVPAQPTNPDDFGAVQEHASSSRFARRLSAAALAMDVRVVSRVLEDSIAVEGPLRAWEEVMRPVLGAVGKGWRSARSGPEAEYLLAELTRAALIRATPDVAKPRNHHPVLLAAPPEERGNLTPYALAAEFAGQRIDPLVLGDTLTVDVLAATVRRTSPAAVVLCAQRPRAANPLVFARLARGRQRSRLFACGPGWNPGSLPSQVEHIGGTRDIVERIVYVLLGTQRTPS